MNVPLRRLTVVIALAFLAGLLLSPRVWMSERSFPLVAPLGWFPPVPPPLDCVWFAALLVLLVAVVLAPESRRRLAAFVVLAGLYCLGDQARWQPWAYEYLVLLTALACCPRGPESSAQQEGCLNACRLIVAAAYFWSGVAKVNVTFATWVFPWLIQPFLPLLPSWCPLGPAGYVAPFLEIGIGLGLLLGPLRAPAVCLAVAMHLFILASIGPLGHNWNSIVWPWNVASAILVVLLFWRCPARAPSILWPRAFPFARVVVLLFGVLPALNLVDCWDHYLSMSLYSGNVPDGEILLRTAAAEQLPAEVKPLLKAGPDGWQRLDLNTWSLHELNVPAYPQERAYLGLARRVAELLGPRAAVVLVVRARPDRLSGEQREMRYYFGPVARERARGAGPRQAE